MTLRTASIVLGIFALGGMLAAQTALTQLGLTETSARNDVISEIRSPALDRRNEIVIFGTRAFLKLPASARGAAAAGLFAWAKTYVNSAAFKTTYATIRKQSTSEPTTYETTVDQEVQNQTQKQLEYVEGLRKIAAGMSGSEAASVLQQAKEAETQIKNPATIEMIRKQVEMERAEKTKNEKESNDEVEQKYPADPRRLFARRLREFLNETVDLNFSARTISLTGGSDGIEFINPEDRKRSWMWQEAVLVGPEAVAAARAAAEAWLKELEQ